MAKWANAAVLDGGLNYIRDNASRMILINNYVAGDSYATVTGAALATVTMTTGTASSDYVISTPTATSNRQIATVTKSATATANSSTPDLHIAFTNGSNTVIWVTDETTNQQIVNGNTINFPAITYVSQQPS